MFGEGEMTADISATAKNATAAATTPRIGDLLLSKRTVGTNPAAAKRRTTANLGVKVTPLVFGDAARQSPAAPIAAKIPRALAPPNCRGNGEALTRTDSLDDSSVRVIGTVGSRGSA
jgi:hypothetical protein